MPATKTVGKMQINGNLVLDLVCCNKLLTGIFLISLFKSQILLQAIVRKLIKFVNKFSPRVNNYGRVTIRFVFQRYDPISKKNTKAALLDTNKRLLDRYNIDSL